MALFATLLAHTRAITRLDLRLTLDLLLQICAILPITRDQLGISGTRHGDNNSSVLLTGFPGMNFSKRGRSDETSYSRARVFLT